MYIHPLLPPTFPPGFQFSQSQAVAAYALVVVLGCAVLLIRIALTNRRAQPPQAESANAREDDHSLGRAA